MRKTSKWIKSFLTSGKKEHENVNTQPSSIPTENPTTPIIIPPATPKEKRRWSFRRSSAMDTTTKDLNSTDTVYASASAAHTDALVEAGNVQNQHAMAVAAATAAVIRLTNAGAPTKSIEIEEAAALKIQAAFRSYLAKRALCALKGLVKLQALVRGQLVRKQATAILRCMQALVTVQERAQAQRLRMAEEAQPITQRQSVHRKSSQDIRLKRACSVDRGMENINIEEMDFSHPRGSSKGRNSYSNQSQERGDPRFSAYYPSNDVNSKQAQLQNSPAPSALTEISPRTCSGHFEEYSFITAQISPQCYSAVSKLEPPTRASFAFLPNEFADFVSIDYPFHPNYMANTESSRAKARSQSAPKQRSESYERQLSSRRSTMEGRNIPQGMRMQRSSSHVGHTIHGYQHPWSIKLDKSSVSLKDSECCSTSTMLTNTSYCRSLAANEHQGNRF